MTFIAKKPPVAEPSPLYATRQKIYPRRVRGPWRRLKWGVLGFCLALYYLLPWLRWDRGFGRPSQALLIDLPNRRGYFFNIEIWPQEVIYLTGILILAAIGLFFVTSLFGRLWCGYACPQTVWTDLFMLAERIIEGDRHERMKLDREKLSLRKAAIKGTKHAVWLFIAFATGGAWVMYFADAPTVTRQFFLGEASVFVYGFVGLLTTTTYLLAGWAREQVCTYMCPWPRFQASMVDEHTLMVTYRGWRGEPRGKLKKGEPRDERGDCIDCRACVQVCPTGIDIRDGLQLECINCGLCIDSCNEIMRKVGFERGLIAFDTLANLAARERGEKVSWKFLRPRTIAYAAMLTAIAFMMAAALWNRSTLTPSVLAERSPLYVALSDGSIRNSFTLKLANKQAAPRLVQVAGVGPEGARLSISGVDSHEVALTDGLDVLVPADAVGTWRVFIRTPKGAVSGEAPLTFTFRAADGETAEYAATLRGPGR